MTASAPADPTRTSTVRTVALRNGLTVTIREYGAATDGTGVLMLHGGSGPRSMAGFAAGMSEHAYVVVPTHPGFNGTPRPDSTDSIADLAVAYLDLIDVLGLRAVVVVGSSIGGWIAAEMGVRDNRGTIKSLVLLGATGIRPEPEVEIVDAATISPPQFFRRAYHDPQVRSRFAALSRRRWPVVAANQRTVAVYTGDAHTHDPKLIHRLHRVTVPVLVVWGEQDGIVPLEYGRALAGAFPHATFRSIPQAGHFPHIEQPGAVFAAIGDFVQVEAASGAH